MSFRKCLHRFLNGADCADYFTTEKYRDLSQFFFFFLSPTEPIHHQSTMNVLKMTKSEEGTKYTLTLYSRFFARVDVRGNNEISLSRPSFASVLGIYSKRLCSLAHQLSLQLSCHHSPCVHCKILSLANYPLSYIFYVSARTKERKISTRAATARERKIHLLSIYFISFVTYNAQVGRRLKEKPIRLLAGVSPRLMNVSCHRGSFASRRHDR